MLCSKILLTPCENVSMVFDACWPNCWDFTTFSDYVYGPHKVNAQDLWLRSVLILTCFCCLVSVFFV